MLNPSGDAQRTYLARVLPWPQEGDEQAYIGVHWSFKGNRKEPGWAGRAVRSVNEAVNAIAWAMRDGGTLGIYACMGSQKEAIEVVTPRSKWYKPVRSQTNIVALKSLFLDIDFKGGEHGYDTPQDAISALQQFLTATGLPRPSVIVRTGGGLHVYWTLDKRIPRHEWDPLAFALAEATKRHGFKCDTQCTVDASRVLRIPGTLNRKTDPPRPVTLVGATDFDYSTDKISQLLEPYKVARNGSLNGALPHKTPLTGVSDLAAGVDLPDNRPFEPKSVLRACPFLFNAVQTGGKDYTNPLWMMTTLAATFMEKGRQMAHVMGNKHPGYTPASTDALYDRKIKEKADLGLGWPSCQTISAYGSKVCQTCPHYLKGKTPFHFAQRVSQPVPAAAKLYVPAPFNDLPKGYTRDHTGVVNKQVTLEDGTITESPVHHAPLMQPWLQKDPTWTLNFTTILDKPAQIKLPLEAVNAPHEMRKLLQSQGFMIYSYEHKTFGDFLVAWVNKLKETRDAVISTSPFGWQMRGNKVEGFVYGGQVWTAGAPQLAPNPDVQTAKRYTPTGEMQPWLDMAQVITNQELPQLDAILAAAFAGPLTFISGHKGLLLSAYSTESGVGKSTAQSVAQAVWGNPRHRQMLNDTEKSVMNKIGELRHLPFFWDELKTEDQTRRFVSTVFQMDQGREVSRLNASVKQRDVGEWNTLMVCCSNDSLLDFVTSRTRMTTAGLYRIFEYEVPKRTKGKIDVSLATRMTAALEYNFGQAGLVYAKFLGANYPRIHSEVIDFQSELNQELEVQEDERYWTTVVASICMGAKFANELGLTKFNLGSLREFMITTLSNMRGIRKDAPVDLKDSMSVSDIFAQFMAVHRSRNTLKTNRIHLSAGKPPIGVIKTVGDPTRLERLDVHVGVEDKIVRIRSAALSDWLHEKGYSRHVFIRALKDQFGVREVRGRLGSGTDYADSTAYLLEMDLSGSPLVNFIDEA